MKKGILCLLTLLVLLNSTFAKNVKRGGPKYGLITKESGISYPQGCQKSQKCRQK